MYITKCILQFVYQLQLRLVPKNSLSLMTAWGGGSLQNELPLHLVSGALKEEDSSSALRYDRNRKW